MIGYVYKLIDIRTNKAFYVGSTETTVKSRFTYHVSDLKRKKYKIYEKIKEIGIDNVKPIELEIVQYDDIFTLRQREQYWMDKLNTKNDGCNVVNAIKKKIEPGTLIHKKKIIQWRQYYHKNKEEYNKKIKCFCGVYHLKQHKARHEKSKAHIEYLKKYPEMIPKVIVPKGKILCKCGSVIRDTKRNLKQHSKSKKHKKYLESLEQKNIKVYDID